MNSFLVARFEDLRRQEPNACHFPIIPLTEVATGYFDRRGSH